MKRADITLSVPLPDEATDEDAQALGEMIARLALQEGEPNVFDIRPAGQLLQVDLVEDGNRLGRAGAHALLDRLEGEGRR